MSNKTNEASVDKDFEAAVLQLRAGNRTNLLKFGAILLLTMMFAGGLFAFVLTVGDTVSEMFTPDLSGVPSDLEE